MKKALLFLSALLIFGAGAFVAVKYLPQNKTPDNETESSSSSSSSYSETSEFSQTQTTAVSSVESPKAETEFSAEIDKVSGDSLTVCKIENNKDLSGYSSASVNFTDAEILDSKGKSVNKDDVKNFAKADIKYSGGVMGIYPPAVNADKIILKNRFACNVYFYVGEKLIKTMTVNVGSDIDSADMPKTGNYIEDGYHFDGWKGDSGFVYGIQNITDSVTLKASISQD